MREFWEVRHDGVLYCHCGTLRSALRVAEMSPLRSVHRRPIASVEAETVDVSAVSLGHEKSLEPQLILNQSDSIKIDLT